MPKSIKLVVVIPLGPSAKPEYVSDTIESVIHYTGPSTRIILVDDSGIGTGKNLQYHFSNLDVLTTPGSCGYGQIGQDGSHGANEGGLYYWLSLAYSHAVTNYDFDVILKMDEDALIIGETPEKEAIHFFRQNENVGLIGSYKVDCNGDPREFSGADKKILRETSLRRLLKNPRLWMAFRRILSLALANGYEPGENVQGGACFLSSECIQRLKEANLLPKEEFRASVCDEDYLFPLLVKSVGMDLGDFATGRLPMGIRWRGLPCAPEELVARRKKIIHSTRFWGNVEEDEIRKFFCEHRKRRV